MVKLKKGFVAMLTLSVLAVSLLSAGCHHRADGTGGGPGGDTDTDKYETGSREQG